MFENYLDIKLKFLNLFEICKIQALNNFFFIQQYGIGRFKLMTSWP